MKHVFDQFAKNIRVYLATETVVDPFEKNTELVHLNPLPIKALVTDLTASQAQWKMIGIIADKAKEIIIEKKYRSLIEKSAIIEVEGELYNGWKVNHKLQIRQEGDYLRCYIYIKKS